MNKLLQAVLYAPVWRPAVALMRQMRFPAKMGLIGCVFLIPIVGMLLALASQQNAAITATESERAGVGYAQTVYQAMDLAGRWRQQARNLAFGEGGEGLAQARQDFDRVHSRLSAMQTARGTRLNTARAWASYEQAVQAARAAQPAPGVAADPEAVYQGMIGVSRTLSDLLDAVADGSGLALDPEIASYNLGLVVLQRAPDVIQSTIELRGLVRSALKAGSITPANLARLEGHLALLRANTDAAKVALGKVQAASPEWAAQLTRGSADTTQGFLAQVRSAVPIGASAVHADAPAFVALANQLLTQQFKQVDHNLGLLDAMLAQRQTSLIRQRVLVLGLTALTLLLGVYLCIGFYRATMGGFAVLHRHLLGIAMGDLRTPIRAEGQDEIAYLLKELAAMQHALGLTVTQVQSASDEVVSASNQIAQGTHDLAARTESAAAALEQSSAALEQTNSTVAMTAQNVQDAARIASNNANAASRGGAVMQDVADTMGRIQASSQKISDIIGVIDGIAFQTNILALNAAVEAARAGEQGRGFAVVAGEVRALAQRSAEAAKEIKTLIVTSTTEVSRGSGIVQQASEHMHEIVGNAEKVHHLLNEVANGAREQTLGIGQIGEAVHELDRNTQANAALVEQTDAQAKAMRGAAVRMAAQVDEFQLPGALASAPVEGVSIDPIIEGHRQWKVKLRQAIDERAQVDVASLSRDDCCALGQWIYGDGQRLSARPSFTTLVARHAAFHQVAGGVGQLINDRQYERAQDALAPGTPFSQATSEVVQVLASIKRLGFV